MINRASILFLLILSLAVFIWPLKSKNFSNPEEDADKSFGVSNSLKDLPTHPLIFFDEKNFYYGVAQAEKEHKNVPYHIAGGIIPHDLFPSFIIADFFYRLSFQKPKTIILIGPNHYEKGDFKSLSSLYGWQTPFGVVEPNDLVINKLVLDNLIRIAEDILYQEHSLAGIMSFIKFYLPAAKVVPIILSATLTNKEAEVLAKSLKDHLNNDAVIIAPVDFSHYLTNKEAQEKDRTTLMIIKNFDYRQLFILGNDYLDGSAAIATLLLTMQQKGNTNVEVLYHTNSGELQNQDYRQTTSYFSIAFY